MGLGVIANACMYVSHLCIIMYVQWTIRFSGPHLTGGLSGLSSKRLHIALYSHMCMCGYYSDGYFEKSKKSKHVLLSVESKLAILDQ